MSKRLAWTAVLAAASFMFSLALACATPFAALAAIGALALPFADALLVAFLAWLVNQLTGYLLLGYPMTWDSFAWGAVLGLSALAAVGGARWIAMRTASFGIVAMSAAALLAAFAVQQGVVFAAAFVLPSQPSAFAPSVVATIFGYNLLAFAILGVLQLAGARLGATSDIGSGAMRPA
ncbi:hypothetical protein [Hoeflea sp.]|uniref:hypothetical protein n=1 Tax=Hoeflea sp. TaxID=1940281 RepID=UPI003B52C19A